MEVSRQFAGQTPASYTGPSQPQPDNSDSRPLSLGASTFGSVKENTTWRKPRRVLPHSKATQGSTFNPYD